MALRYFQSKLSLSEKPPTKYQSSHHHNVCVSNFHHSWKVSTKLAGVIGTCIPFYMAL